MQEHIPYYHGKLSKTEAQNILENCEEYKKACKSNNDFNKISVFFFTGRNEAGKFTWYTQNLMDFRNKKSISEDILISCDCVLRKIFGRKCQECKKEHQDIINNRFLKLKLHAEYAYSKFEFIPIMRKQPLSLQELAKLKITSLKNFCISKEIEIPKVLIEDLLIIKSCQRINPHWTEEILFKISVAVFGFVSGFFAGTLF